MVTFWLKTIEWPNKFIESVSTLSSEMEDLTMRTYHTIPNSFSFINQGTNGTTRTFAYYFWNSFLRTTP